VEGKAGEEQADREDERVSGFVRWARQVLCPPVR